MNNMNNFCLNWNGYDSNIRESFKKLREDQRLFDVTLVTDDGHHIQAHKIILSAGSNFFSDIFIKSNHSNMLVYLKGISSDKIEPVLDFIYNGEAFITQERLEIFIETGKELQVKGLEGELTGVPENGRESSTNPQESEYGYDVKENDKELEDLHEGTVANMDEGNHQVGTNYAIGFQINKVIEKNDGVWRCKICGKTATTNGNIRKHAELHIEGLSYSCHICNKTFTNKNSLNVHISNAHKRMTNK